MEASEGIAEGDNEGGYDGVIVWRSVGFWEATDLGDRLGFPEGTTRAKN
jgi:hypothetical protein